MAASDKVYLVIRTLKWGAGALLVAILLSFRLFGDWRNHLDLLLTMSGYAAFFPGFLGGVIRLFHKE